MADSVIIKLDGDDSSYSKVLSLAEKKAKETAEKARKAVDEAYKAMQKAAEETNEENKKLAEEAARLAKDTSDKAIAEAERAQKELKKVQDELSKQQTEVMNKNAEGIAVINSGAKKVAIAAGAAGAAVLGIGVNYNSQMEQYMAGFTTMLGNAEKAQGMMNDLKDFAASTPFEMENLADASTTLLAFGEDVNELMPDLKMLGDISLGNKEKFKSLALVFGQVQSQGRLMGQDLLQMINAGFNPLQIISEKTGKSVAELKDEMSEGAISFEMVADAMKTATAEGGQFFNAMETQSQTAKGQLSTLKDNVTALFGEMSEGASEILAEDVLPRAIELVEWLNEKLKDGTLEKYFKGGAVTAATFGGALGALNIALVVNDLINLKKGTEAYTAATKLGTAAQKVHNAALLSNPYALVGMALTALVAGLAAYDLAVESSTEKALKAAEEHKKAVDDILASYDEAIEEIEKAEAAEKAEAEQVLLLKDRLYDLEEQIKSGTLTEKEAEAVKNDFASAAKQLEEIIPGITQSLYDETGAIDIQKSSIDSLTSSYYDLAVAKAASTAYEKKFNKAVEKRIKLQDEFDEQIETLKPLSDQIQAYEARYYEGQGDYKALRAEFKAKYGYEMPDMTDAQIKVTQRTFNKEFENNNETFEKLTAAKKEEKELFEEWQNYRTELEELTQLYTDAGGKTDTTTTNTYTTTGKTSSKTIETLSDLEREVKDLEYKQKVGLINEENYFKERKRLRDTYLKEDTEEWYKHTQEINSAYKKWYDKERSDLDYKYKMGIIGEQEYYSQIAALRDKFLEENTTDWQKYTQELSEYISKKKDEILSTWKDALSEFEEERKSFSDSLKAENKAYQTYTFHTENGTETYTSLADLSAENRKLEQYDALLSKFIEKSNGDIPNLVASQLKNMSADEAVKYLTALLNSTDEQFMKQIDDINYNSSLSEGISTKLFGDEAEELKKRFEETFDTLPPEFFDFGAESGEEFGKGFEKALDAMMEDIKLQIASEFSSVIPDVIIKATPNQTGGNTYNDNRSTTFNVSGNSPRTAMEIFKANQQYQAHTSQYGG